MDSVKCTKCSQDMPAERLEFGLDTCKDCTDAKPLYGFMVYDEKCGGELCMTESRSAFEMATALIDLRDKPAKEKVVEDEPTEDDKEIMANPDVKEMAKHGITEG